ncbi:MAG: riboflavin biosynthesis protein RibF [Alphaproteobacteria bacterium]|nr:riboflavin biosynthesis protein RibF [Alphaproteobacteria bacterium]
MTFLVRNYQDYHHGDKGHGVVIGNFDGLHEGHQILLKTCSTICTQRNLKPILLTFEPHPRTYFQRIAHVSSENFRLTTLRDKIALLDQFCINTILAQRFSRHFAGLSAQKFMDDVLLKSLNAQTVIIGYDFHFGQKRQGDPDMLKYYLEPKGVDVVVIERQTLEGGEEHASSRIREYLRDGETHKATRMLTRPFQMSGHVSPGRKLARQLGFPTANVHTSNYLLPKLGVYAGHAIIDEELIPAVANIGVKPTVTDDEPSPLLEVHLFRDVGDIYAKRLTFRFEEFIRPEKKFDGLDALAAQIQADKQSAMAYFER